MPKHFLKMLAVSALSFASVTASAGVLGTNITGGMYFSGGSTNYFNSNQGFVPSGCQNSNAGSATVTAVNPTVEFCFSDGANQNSAQFTDNTLSITDIVGSSASAWKMTFAFAPDTVLGVSETSDLFSNGGLSYSFLNDILTLNWAGTGTAGTLNAQYALQIAPANDVPEPSSIALLCVGLLAARSTRSKRDA